MGLELGRVSGSLLAANLLRNGENLAFESDLLYFDVNNRYIGVKNSIPSNQLHTTGTIHTSNLLVDTSASLGDLSILTNRIQNPLGPIYISPNQSSNPTVTVHSIEMSNLAFDATTISNIINNDDINITVPPTGKLHVTVPVLEIGGDLHVTGNIKWDYNFILSGDLHFDAIQHSLSPSVSNIYNLGLSSLPWANLFVVSVRAGLVISNSLTVDQIDLLANNGNIIYVSINGADTNRGTHLHSPLKTIKHALSVATFGTEIDVFPGTYQEIFPLTVPSGVTVRGTGVRAVRITPTPSTKYNDAFLLNGDTTVSFLTVSNFFYDSIHNTGYAFRFAPNFKSIAKSPYVYHVDVITTGSVVSQSDPHGFNQGDAGAGIYLDGSVVDPTYTLFPSGLFYEVSLTVPNQDGLTATNGVRIEWINAHTYFAKNSIYLTTGILGTASLGINFGAEFRGINGTNLYGINGVVADGLDTRATLTNHYFGYVGSGKDSTNNVSNVIQSNEVIAIHGGIIYYDSVDQIGFYRAGDIFYVDQSTDRVTITALDVNYDVFGSISFDSVSGIVSLDKFAVASGNIRIYDNNIISLAGPVNFSALDSTILNTNVTVTGLIGISGDMRVNGDVYLGNTKYDTVTVRSLLTQTIKPLASDTLSLGEPSTGLWRTGYIKSINVAAITQISSNVISIIPVDTDLQLVAAGSGVVHSVSNVNISNNIFVTGDSTVVGNSALRNTVVTGDVTQTGDVGQTGTTGLTGTLASHAVILTGSTSYAQSSSIKIYNNNIAVMSDNSDILFTAPGAGSVIFENSLKVTNSTILNSYVNPTTDIQRSIIFAPSGTGSTIFSSANAVKIPVGLATSLSTTGSIALDSTTAVYGGYAPSGLLSFTNLYSTDRRTYITPELSTGTNDNIIRFATSSTVRMTIDQTKLWSNSIVAGNVKILGNTVSNTNINDDLTFAGFVKINWNGLLVDGSDIINNITDDITLSSTGYGYVKFSGSNGVVIPIGQTVDRRLTPEPGEIRYNTDVTAIELFDGYTWGGMVRDIAISPEEVYDIIEIMALIFG